MNYKDPAEIARETMDMIARITEHESLSMSDVDYIMDRLYDIAGNCDLRKQTAEETFTEVQATGVRMFGMTWVRGNEIATNICSKRGIDYRSYRVAIAIGVLGGLFTSKSRDEILADIEERKNDQRSV